MDLDYLAPSPPKVFISSTWYDLAPIRQELGDYLTEIGFQAVLFESAGALPTTDGPTSALRHAVQCDICVLMVGTQYGTRSDTEKISFTQLEYRAARDAGKPIFAFIQQETLVRLQLFSERPTADVWSQDERDLFLFVQEISGDRTRFPFMTPGDLKKALRYQLVSYYGYLLRAYSDLESISPTTSSQWMTIGERFWNAAKFGQAIYCYRKAASADSYGDACGALIRLAFALRVCGRPRDALEVCNEGIERFPVESIALRVQATNCLFELGRDSEALENAENTVAKFSDDWRPWDNLRYACGRMRLFERGAEAAKNAFALAPENDDLRRNAGTFERYRRAVSDKDYYDSLRQDERSREG